MFGRSKGWVSGGLWKPKNPHSLEHLKYLYGVLTKNQNVTEQNRALLVESLRSISEILIWGDQNDSTVFDFFLEKNMLSFFLQFMKQKYGRYICVQLLQTLNILFENISNKTSVYYLLSNNHVNSIIVHKFDFSDEEVMAYYISFLKTLSLRLNKHTIHFFYNEHTNDFPLYTEGIKFFNHSESMVRIAVRTITLNVYKVQKCSGKTCTGLLDKLLLHKCTFLISEQNFVQLFGYMFGDKSMLRYIRDKTAAPYFSNLVWFIGKNVLDIDACVRHDTDHTSKDRLADLVAEHLDHLHYVNDILGLQIDALNEVLTDHLLHNLLLPLYVYSLLKSTKYEMRTEERLHVSPVVSLFLLSQVFLIINHNPLVRQLAEIIFNADVSIFQAALAQSPKLVCGFVKPRESLAKTLDKNRGHGGRPLKRPNYKNTDEPGLSTEQVVRDLVHRSGNSTFYAQQRSEEGDASESPQIPHGTDDLETDPDTETETVESQDQYSQADSEETYSQRDAAIAEGTYSQQDSATDDTQSQTESVTTEGYDSQSEPASQEGQYSESETVGPDSAQMKDLNVEAGKEQEQLQVQFENDTRPAQEDTSSVYHQHLTDDEKLASQNLAGGTPTEPPFTLQNRPYLQAVFKRLDCHRTDYGALFSLCLLYALSHNPGMTEELLQLMQLPTSETADKRRYNSQLMEALIAILGASCTEDSAVRLATLELCIKLLVSMVTDSQGCYLQDGHLAAIEGVREEASLLLRNFYKVWEKSEEIFLDMFEDEYREMHLRPLNVEYLTMDASILLPPTSTPLSGIDFIKRRPCGEVERARRAIRVFFYLRGLSLTFQQEVDSELPLTREEECVKVGDVLDLNNSDLIACTVINKDQQKRERRFLVIDVLQLILVEPDCSKLGWGRVTFVGFLQDVDVTGDKEDSRSLYITIYKPSLNAHCRPLPLLSARFLFDDHIRCMAAKQRLTKGRLRARQRKMMMIARLLELPSQLAGPPFPTQTQGYVTGGASPIPGRGHPIKSPRWAAGAGATGNDAVQRSVFAGVDFSPAFTNAATGPAASRSRTKGAASKTPDGSRAEGPGGVVMRRQLGGGARKTTPEASTDAAARRSARASAAKKQTGSGYGKTGSGVATSPATATGVKSEREFGAMDMSDVVILGKTRTIEEAVEAETSLGGQEATSREASGGRKRLSKYYGLETAVITPQGASRELSEEDKALEEMSRKANRLLVGTRELFKDSRQHMSTASSIPADSSKEKSVSSEQFTHAEEKGTIDDQEPKEPENTSKLSDSHGVSEEGGSISRDGRPSPQRKHNHSHSGSSPTSDAMLTGATQIDFTGTRSDGEDDSESTLRRPRAHTGPKTLTSATAPTLSLIVSCQNAVDNAVGSSGLDSPHLIPPTAGTSFCENPNPGQNMAEGIVSGQALFPTESMKTQCEPQKLSSICDTSSQASDNAVNIREEDLRDERLESSQNNDGVYQGGTVDSTTNANSNKCGEQCEESSSIADRDRGEDADSVNNCSNTDLVDMISAGGGTNIDCGHLLGDRVAEDSTSSEVIGQSVAMPTRAQAEFSPPPMLSRSPPALLHEESGISAVAHRHDNQEE